jgi:hypothetical protein
MMMGRPRLQPSFSSAFGGRLEQLHPSAIELGLERCAEYEALAGSAFPLIIVGAPTARVPPAPT